MCHCYSGHGAPLHLCFPRPSHSVTRYQVRETLRKYHKAPSRGFRKPPPPSAKNEELETWINNRLRDEVREMLDFG